MELSYVEQKIGTADMGENQIIQFQYYVSDLDSPNKQLIDNLQSFGRRGGVIGITTASGKVIWGQNAPEHRNLVKNYGEPAVLRFEALNEGNKKIELQIHTLEKSFAGELIQNLKDSNCPENTIISVYLVDALPTTGDYSTLVHLRSLKSVDPAQFK